VLDGSGSKKPILAVLGKICLSSQIGFWIVCALWQWLSMVGDGQSSLFWHDRWLMRQRIADLTPHVFSLAPHVFSLVPKKLVKRRTMADALCCSSWLVI
jgi:hypothetical protein